MRSVRKITIAQAVKQGDVTLEIWCVGPGQRVPYGGGANVCGHHAEMKINKAIELFGAERSLSDLPLRCSVCGSREVDTRAKPSTQLGRRWI